MSRKSVGQKGTEKFTYANLPSALWLVGNPALLSLSVWAGFLFKTFFTPILNLLPLETKSAYPNCKSIVVNDGTLVVVAVTSVGSWVSKNPPIVLMNVVTLMLP